MKVTKWTWWSTDNKYPDIPNELWEESRKVVSKEIRRCGYRFTGSYHQQGEHGCPIIDDKYAVRCSMRGWGKIIQEAYPEEIDSYIDYAWSNETEILP